LFVISALHASDAVEIFFMLTLLFRKTSMVFHLDQN